MCEITLSFKDVQPTITRKAAIELKNQLDDTATMLRESLSHRGINPLAATLIRMIADSIDDQLEADIITEKW